MSHCITDAKKQSNAGLNLDQDKKSQDYAETESSSDHILNDEVLQIYFISLSFRTRTGTKAFLCTLEVLAEYYPKGKNFTQPEKVILKFNDDILDNTVGYAFAMTNKIKPIGGNAQRNSNLFTNCTYPKS